MSSVEKIRKEIDFVDQQIHDLLIQRARLALQVGEAKRKGKQPIIRPDREASKIRALLERHSGEFPRASIVRIWREIIGAVSLLQTEMKVAVAPPLQNPQECWDMARDYFGSAIPLQGVANPLVAISMVREGEANFAVLPWPEDDTENPWWAYLISDDPEQNLRIVIRLPYGEKEAAIGYPEHRALAVARLGFESSGQDHSFLLLTLDQSVSRARIVDKIKATGMTALSIYSRRERGMQNRNVHLVEVDSFVATDDARLQDLLNRLENPEGQCVSLGGYPLLPVLSDTPVKEKKSA